MLNQNHPVTSNALDRLHDRAKSSPRPLLVPTSTEQKSLAESFGVAVAELPPSLRVTWVDVSDTHHRQLAKEITNTGGTIKWVSEIPDRRWVSDNSDLLIIPDTHIPEQNFQTPTLVSDGGNIPHNSTVEFDRSTLELKMTIMTAFHGSQSARTRYDLIIEASATHANGGNFREIFQTSDGRPAILPEVSDTHYHFISPHPDDVEISCGGTLKSLGDAGVWVDVVVATAGHRPNIHAEDLNHEILPPELRGSIPNEGPIPSPNTRAQIRQIESRSACRALNPLTRHCALNLPLYDHSYEITEADHRIVAGWLDRLDPEHHHRFFLPMVDDQHPCHLAVATLFRNQIDSWQKSGHDCAMVHYPTPWTGTFHLICYSATGHKLAGLAGSEQLVGKGHVALPLDQFGDRAERYRFI